MDRGRKGRWWSHERVRAQGQAMKGTPATASCLRIQAGTARKKHNRGADKSQVGKHTASIRARLWTPCVRHNIRLGETTSSEHQRLANTTLGEITGTHKDYVARRATIRRHHSLELMIARKMHRSANIATETQSRGVSTSDDNS